MILFVLPIVLVLPFLVVQAAAEPSPASTQHSSDTAAPIAGAPIQDASAHCRAAELPGEIAKLPPPPLRRGIGNSSLAISHASAEAQQFFDQGLNALHDFWDIEALRAFRRAAELSPEAPMAYWGIAMSIPQPGPHELVHIREQALKKMAALRESASREEQLFIDAVYARFDTSGPGIARYYDRMETLVRKFPANVEAKLFLARSQLVGYREGVQLPRQLTAEKILDSLLRSHPSLAAVHHYWIHAIELGPEPSRALPSAEALPRLAPASAHIQHMPGHIYFLLGRYDDAMTAFRKAHEVDLHYMSEERISAVDNWNYVHNLEYMVAACAEAGRIEDGDAYADLFGNVVAQAKTREAAGAFKILYDGITAQVRVPFRYGRWEDAIARLEKFCPASITAQSAGSDIYCQALRTYAQTRLHLRSKNLAKATPSLEDFSILHMQLKRKHPEGMKEVFQAAAIETLSILVDELRGLTALAANDAKAATIWFDQAEEKEMARGYGEPPKSPVPVAETRAQALLDCENTSEAAAALDRASKQRPNSASIKLLQQQVSSKRH